MLNKIYEITVQYVEFIPDYVDLEEGVLYVSEKYNVSVHKCFCGCLEKVVLDTRRWRHIESDIVVTRGITIFPSIGSFNLPCNSHYSVTSNKVEWY